MSWRDREYNWEGEGNYGGGTWRPPLTTAWLLGLHLVAFLLLQSVPAESLHPAVAIALSPFGLGPVPWRGALAIITVAFVFLTLGARIERSDGPGTLLGLYLAGTVAGILGHLGFWFANPSGAAIPIGPIPNGAFAAFAMFGLNRYRDELVSVFGYVRSVSWVIGLFGLIILALQFLRMGPTGLGWLLGSFAGGMLAAVGSERLDASEWTEWLRRPRRPRVVVRPSIPSEPPEPEPDPDSEELDRLLGKISASGLDSLDEDEQRRLESLRARMQKRG